MKLVRHVKRPTKAKSLFRDRNRSFYFKFFRAAIFFGNKKGYSKALAR